MLNWFFPQTVETRGTKKVVNFQGTYSVYVDGVQQSGPWVNKIWSKTKFSTGTILVLGSGCGTLISLIRKQSPKSKITGIELDPDMTALGEKYFNLDPSLIITKDAFDFISTTNQKFDQILVDLYHGTEFPSQFASAAFLKKLSQTMSKNAVCVFNRLATKTTTFERTKFVDKLQKYFTIQEIKKIDFNFLISCSRREA